MAKDPGSVYCIIIITIYLTGRFFFHAIPTAMVRNREIIIGIIMKKTKIAKNKRGSKYYYRSGQGRLTVDLSMNIGQWAPRRFPGLA